VKLTLEHNESINAWELKHEDVFLRDDAAIEQWRRLVLEQFEKLPQERAYLLIDMANVELSPAFADQYGEVVREVNAQHSLTMLRFGDTDGWTAMAVEMQGVMNNYTSVVFADRTAALAALSLLRAQAGS
jgi:hypothetical protein